VFSVILYMLRQTLRHRAFPLPFPSFLPSYCDVFQARSYSASAMNMSVLLLFCEPISSVSIVSGYGLDDRAIEVRSGGSFPGDRERPGRDADHSSPSSAEVKNE
jgi:hypothetical protein